MSKALFADVKKMGIISIDDDTRKVRVIPRDVMDRAQDEERSIEINMMRALMRRYPEKAKETASEMFRFVLTNRPA